MLEIVMQPGKRIQAGDPVVLHEDDGTVHRIEAGEGHREIDDLGVVDTDRLVDRSWGQAFKAGSRQVTPLPLRPLDAMRTAQRGAQIVRPEDAGRIVMGAGVQAGDSVLEIGSGSGVLTIALANAVGPSGRVVSFDHRRDHVATAARNLTDAGLADRVSFVQSKAEALAAAGPFDVATLDIPNPEEALPYVADALVPGGGVAVYVPLVSQVEAARNALDEGWVDVRTVEVIERPWTVHDRGSRPEHEMLGHTGFLTFARRAGNA